MIYFESFKERCSDCPCLVEKDGRWFCDEFQKCCKNIGDCAEFEERNAIKFKTIEEMFLHFNPNMKVFKKDGTFTKEALKYYDDVANEYFDSIEDLDKLASEENC